MRAWRGGDQVLAQEFLKRSVDLAAKVMAVIEKARLDFGAAGLQLLRQPLGLLHRHLFVMLAMHDEHAAIELGRKMRDHATFGEHAMARPYLA